ncbi:MAG: beta-galactosidase [Clostridia bacterium]|nr:beta-galactosidase [Clostridia bacterium]
MNAIPRPEYPRPQFQRAGWMNLNGTWQFEIDCGGSGRARNLVNKEKLDGEIIVPFCPESALSGIKNVDFMRAVWYRRSFTLPKAAKGKRVFINFGAVDYECEVWINGVSVGTHRGGYVSFQFEITKALKDGENTIVVCADDDSRNGHQPFGKQSYRYESFGCFYTRTTGIWQTVWLEWTNDERIKSVKMTPDATNASLLIEAELDGSVKGAVLKAQAAFEGEYETEIAQEADGNFVRMQLLIENAHLWNVGEPNLYDLVLTLEKDGKTVDTVNSYFGLRSISFDGMKCLINGKPVFQRLILDQGFYPDGIYTAPTDDELKNDILRSMAMGFNGARLHQKVFEQRFLYWADKLGYICWGEMASWGADPKEPWTLPVFLGEWLEVLKRDYNSPAIVGWCPWNETWGEDNNGQHHETMSMTYRVTKAFDPTRPCIDASGGIHVETDIFDTHDYEQNTEIYKERYAPDAPTIYDRLANRQSYGGQPVFVSEYGGIAWNTEGKGWGYGYGPSTKKEFLERYKGLTEALLNNPHHMGFCYTQLTDVEQEINGLYYYDRRPKFDPEIIHAITSQKAAIEE